MKKIQLFRQLVLLAFLATGHCVWAQREVSIIEAEAPLAGTVAVTVALASQGNENALGFSVSFDPAVLHYDNYVNGADLAGATVNANTSEAGSGRVGYAIALGAGTTFSAGDHALVTLNFTVIASGSTSTDVGFGNSPIGQELASAVAEELIATFSGLTMMAAPATIVGQVQVDGVDLGPVLTINDGASHAVEYFNVAPVAGTTGVATITGAGTTYSVSSGVQIGSLGTGTLNLEDHAQFNSTGWMGVGVSAGGVGFVNVSGGGNLHVSQDFAIGNQPGGMGTVTLTGDGTFAGVDQNALVGWSGTGALNVQGGADFLVDRDLLLGQETADSEGEVTVDGTGSTLEVLADSSVGNRGTGRLVVSNGARFDGNSMTVGSQAGADGDVLIAGGYSNFYLANGLTVGGDAGSTGAFEQTGGFTYGQVTNNVTVGWRGTGSLNIEDGANFNILPKPEPREEWENGSLNIGSESGSGDAPGGFVTVRGVSSETTYGSSLHVAASINFGDTGFGRLDIMDQGFVEAQNLNLHNGIVNVYGGSLKIVTDNPDWGVYVPNSGTFNIGNGSGFTTPRFNLDGGAAHFGSYISTTSFGEGGLESTWDIHNGAVLTHAGLGFGQNEGDSSSVNIREKASVTGTADINIGGQGAATVNVNGGAVFAGTNLNLGNDGGSNGTLNLDGVSDDPTPVPSSATFDHVQVGGSGAAEVGIFESAALTATDGMSIGNNPGGAGSVFISNPGSVLNIARYLNVGWEGTGSLTVEGGAQAALILAEPRDDDQGNSDNGGGWLNIGWSDDDPESDAPNGILTIRYTHDDTPSRLTVARGVGVGQNGGYGVIFLDHGGELLAENLYVKKGRVHVNNNASVQVASGGVDVDPSGTLSLGGGSVQARHANLHGRVTGGGTIAVAENVNSDGEIDPGEEEWTGTLRIVGNLNQNGVTKIDLKGENRDILQIDGDLTLNGSVTVAFASDFAPVNGQSYSIIEWTGTRHGGTPDVQFGGLSGWTFHPSWQGDRLNIIAVSAAPTTAEFNDDFSSDANWHDWSSNAELGFTDNKLKISSTTDGATQTWGAAPPRDTALDWPNVLVGRYDSPWSVSVRAHLESGIGTRFGDEIRMMIQVTQEREGQTVQGNLANLGLVRMNQSIYPNTAGVAAQAVAENRYSGTLTLQPDTAALEEAILRLDYTADRKLVASYAVPVESGTPEFVTIATYDPAELWGAGTASHFRVQLIGQATGFDPTQTPQHPVLPADEAYFADFRSTGLVSESVAAAVAQAAAVNLPQITAQPSSMPALGFVAGGSLILNVGAAGEGLAYQWRKDGVTIEDATNSSYAVTSAGRYDVVVRTEAGAVRSAAVQVHTLDAAGVFPNFAWRNPLPGASSLTDVVFADGKFVAVGVDGVVRTSLNGTSWLSFPTPTSHTVLNGVGYSAALDLFIAVGSGGDLFTWTATPPDDWVRRNVSNSDYYTTVAASPERIVVRGNGNFVVTSTDGATWTRETLSTGGGVESMAFGGGVFVAVGFNGRIERSTDGLTWEITTPPGAASGNAINDVKYIDGQFVAVGGNGLVMTSTDGAEWTVWPTGFGNYFRTVEKIGGTWVVFDNGPRYLTSTNLSDFTMAEVPASVTAFIGSASGAGRIVAVGGGGEIVSSNNGTSWSAHGSSGGLDTFFDGLYAEGKYVFVGSEGAIVTSADGATFARRASPTNGNWLQALIHDGSRFVAAAWDRIAVSEDGETWTDADPGENVVDTGWQALAFNGSTYVAVGDGGRIMSSSDAAAWTERTSGTGQMLASVVWFDSEDQDGFVAVGGGGTILASADGVTWTAQSSPTTQVLQSVRAIDGKLFAVGEGWTLLVSSNGVDWTRIPLDGAGGYSTRDIARLPNGLYVIAGVQGGFYTSPDGEHWTWQGQTITRGQIERIVVGPDSVVVGGRGGTLLQAAFSMGSTAPTIATAPASQTVAIGGNLSLSVQVEGSGPFSYQWFRDGEPVPGSAGMRRTLTLPNVGLEAAGNYTVKVFGVGGLVESEVATITVEDGSGGDSIVGSWIVGDAASGEAVVITFFSNGTYYLAHDGEGDESGGPGMERGGYTWDPATGAFQAYTWGLGDTTGEWGLSHLPPNAQVRLTNDGATLELVSDDEKEAIVCNRIASAANALVGSWILGNAGALDSAVITFLSDGYYFLAEDGEDDEGGGRGMEVGTYTFADGELAATALRETNGNWGLATAGEGVTTLEAELNGDTFEITADEEVLTLVRATVPAGPVPEGPRALVALSTRVHVGIGESAPIASFVVEGFAPKQMLIRGVGPELAANGVSGVLADPVLALHDATGAQIAGNDDWHTNAEGILEASAEAGASPLADGSTSAALLVTLPPGVYTARLSGADGATGVALMEVYEVGEVSRVSHLSMRARAGAGDETMIAGFVVTGSEPQAFLIRALGASSLGLGDQAVADPRISIYGFSGGAPTLIAQNDDWGSAAANGPVANAGFTAGLRPLADASADAALLLTLQPGIYTVHVSGAGDQTGSAQLEIAQIDGFRALRYAPALVAPLLDVTTLAGESASWTAQFIGKGGPVSIQWRKATASGTLDLPGATGRTLTLANLQVSDSGEYRVVLANAAGRTTSVPVLLTVTPPPAPSILAQSSWQKVFPGNAATFAVNAVGAIGYQWQRSINGGLDWSNVSDDATLSGATTATLTIGEVTPDMNGWLFRATLSNPSGDTISTPSALTVLAISEQAGLVQTYTAGNYALPVYSPKVIAGGVVEVSAGGAHTAFIRSDGSLWTVGSNRNGQLGDGTFVDRGTPVQVATGVTKVSASGSHTMFIKSDATLWGMGANWSGKLGLGAGPDVNTPVQVATGVIDVAAAGSHTLFVKADHTLWGVGRNFYGELGDGTTMERTTPVQVATDVAAVATGRYDGLSYFLKTDGTLWSMGQNLNGRLGDGTTVDRSTPVLVASGVAKISAGNNHGMFIKTDGTLWGMGANGSGQLGDGTRTDRPSPVQVATGISNVAAGNAHTVFIKADGSLWATGHNGEGALGAPSVAPFTAMPVPVTEGVAKVSAIGHTMFIKTDGTLWGMGSNTAGQLGDRQSAAKLPALTTGVSRLAAGTSSTNLFRKSDGSLWRQQQGVISQVPDVTGVSDVFVGLYGTVQLVLKTDGALSRLGSDGTLQPVASDVIDAGAGLSYLVYLKTDGSLWGLGRSPTQIEFGDGTEPQKIADHVVSLSASGWHVLFVKDDHTLWGMGTAWGGLVPGDDFAQSVTAPIQLETDVRAAVANPDQNLFIKTDGTLWTRGQGWRNPHGPAVQVDGSVVDAASLDINGTLYLKEDGVLRFRSGVQGELGPIIEVAGGVTEVSGGVDGWAIYLQTPGFGTAPSVTMQPQSAILPVGAAYTLEVQTSGTSPLGYQWFKEDQPVAWARSSTYPIAFATAADAGTYTVVVSNSAGETASAGAVIQLQAGPAFTTHPASQTVNPGTNVTFTASASGTPQPAYQWRKNSVAIPGATSGTLTLNNVQAAAAGSYDVVATNAAGSTTSNAATLGVNSAPTITTAPAGGAVNVGGSFTFSVVAAGTAPFTYQWRKDNVAISGATSATLALSNVQASAAGSYTVVVSNVAGSVTSPAAVLTVNIPPAIGTQPTSRTVVSGTSTTFTVIASGTAPLSYQWRKDGVAMAGATSASLTLNNVQPSAAGSYTVVVTNVAGSVTSAAATLTVNVAPTISAQPFSRTVTVGATTTFSVTAAGTEPLTYQWRKDNVALSGATASTLTLDSVQLTAAGSYTVVVTGAGGSVTSNVALLTVNVPNVAPSFTLQPVSQTVTENDLVTFTASAAGTVPLNFQWRKNGVPIVGATNSTLNFIATLGSAGDYTVVVSNVAGTATSTIATLTVNPAAIAPAITAQPVNQTVTAGVTATFTVGASGTGPLSYQWRRNGSPISGATSATLQLANPQAANAGNYSVVVTNSVGSATSADASLTVNPAVVAPTITTSPVSQTVTSGTSVTFSVIATGTQPLSHQWQRNGVPLAGATGATLSLASPQLSDSGSYNVIVANSAGIAISATATLTVNPAGTPPSITTQPIGKTVTAGGNATFTAAASGTAPITLQWHRNGAPVSGATSATLVLNNVQSGHSGSYALVATNAYGSATSAPASLTVNPAVFAPSITSATVAASALGSPFGYTITASNSPTSFGANGLPAGLSVNTSTGVISGTATSAGTFAVGLSATNAGGTGTASLTLIVVQPVPVVTSAPTATGRVGETFAYTITGTNSPTSFGAVDLPAGLSLNTTTGVISGTPATAGTFTAQLTASNATGAGAPATLVITIAPSASVPVITSDAAATGKVGEAFTYVIAASNSPTSFAAADLPAGLTLNTATGLISGTPTVSGTFGVTISANNATGAGTPLMVVFTIAPAATAPAIMSSTSAGGTVGSAFSYAIIATNTPTSFSAGGLPDGLAVNVATGLVSGTPTVAGTFNVTLGATNAGGTGTATLTLTIAPGASAPAIMSSPTANGRVGDSFSYAIVATNTPTAFSAANLPAGLTLNTSTGIIGGTPTVAGTFGVTLTASNAAGAGTPLTLTLTIAPAALAPVITSDASALGTTGMLFTYQITASNGPITGYAATGLPAGLAVDPLTGVITGTPTQAGSSAVVLTASNAAGTSTPLALLLTVSAGAQAPAITSSLTAAGTQGELFTYLVTASNMPSLLPLPPGNGYHATGLPAGLALNPSNGIVVGTPSVTGSFEVSLSATNDAGTGAVKTLVITIDAAATAPVITSGTTAAAVAGSAFSYPITASNTPTSFDATGRPAWLSIDTATGRLSGTPPAPGTFTTALVASNVAGTSAPVALTITVAPAAGSPVVTSTLLASGAANTAFAYQITASNGPLTGYLASELPDGLSLNPATGEISGTPEVPGTYEVPIAAVNAIGVGGAKTLAITIDAAPGTPVIGGGGTAAPIVVERNGLRFLAKAVVSRSASALNDGELASSATVGVPYAFQITASGNPTRYSATNLPAGLAVNPGTGLISGAPAVSGTFRILVRASNNLGVGASATLVLTVEAPPTAPAITSALSASGTVGTAFSYTAAATNTPTSFNVVGLPSGLALNAATGVISGTPAKPGSFAVKLSANNGVGTGSQVTLNVTIAPAAGAPAIASATSANGTLGVAFSHQVVTSPAATSFTASGLPPGLAIDLESGAIAGTPALDGEFTATIAARNDAGASAPFTMIFTIAPPASTSSITSAANVTATVGATFAYATSASNAPTSYNISDLPTGLAANSTTGLIQGVLSTTGTYEIRISANNASGTGASFTLTLTIVPPSNPPDEPGEEPGEEEPGIPTGVPGSRFLALATRAHVSGGDNVLIVGFVINGEEAKPVMIRAIGPGLARQGVNGVLADPTIELFRRSTMIGGNDNWGSEGDAAAIASTAARVGAFALEAGSTEAVILTTLPPGVYSAIVRGNNSGAGVALAEIYDASEALPASAPRMVAIASRGVVGLGENILISGFVINGEKPKQVLIRAVGPTLDGLGVSGALANPNLRLFRSGVPVAENDDWSALANPGELAELAASLGMTPLVNGSKDAALLITLQPGLYTVHVEGVSSTSGVALLEVYETTE